MSDDQRDTLAFFVNFLNECTKGIRDKVDVEEIADITGKNGHYAMLMINGVSHAAKFWYDLIHDKQVLIMYGNRNSGLTGVYEKHYTVDLTDENCVEQARDLLRQLCEETRP